MASAAVDTEALAMPGRSSLDTTEARIEAGLFTNLTWLAKGGMAQVYRADYLDGAVAIKIAAGDKVRLLFQDEWALGVLADVDGVPDLYASGRVESGDEELDGKAAVVMELVAAVDLEKQAATGLLKTEVVLPLVAEAAGIIKEAHAVGVAHRDIKPSNIVWDGEKAYVLDWGSSTEIDSEPAPYYWTMIYHSPDAYDQSYGKRDVYLFGLVMHDLLKGRNSRRPAEEKQDLHRNPENLRLSLDRPPSDCPTELWEIVKACLVESPDECPEMSEVATRLGHLAATEGMEGAELTAALNTQLFELNSLDSLLGHLRSRNHHEIGADAPKKEALEGVSGITTGDNEDIDKLRLLRAASSDVALQRAVRKEAEKAYKQLLGPLVDTEDPLELELALEAAQFYLTRDLRLSPRVRKIGRKAIDGLAAHLDGEVRNQSQLDSLAVIVLGDMALSHRWLRRKNRTARRALQECTKVVKRKDFVPETLEIAHNIDITAAARFRSKRWRRINRSMKWYNRQLTRNGGIGELRDPTGLAFAYGLIGRSRANMRISMDGDNFTATMASKNMAKSWYAGFAVSVNPNTPSGRRRSKPLPERAVRLRRSRVTLGLVRVVLVVGPVVGAVVGFVNPTSGQKVDDWLSNVDPLGIDLNFDFSELREGANARIQEANDSLTEFGDEIFDPADPSSGNSETEESGLPAMAPTGSSFRRNLQPMTVVGDNGEIVTSSPPPRPAPQARTTDNKGQQISAS